MRDSRQHCNAESELSRQPLLKNAHVGKHAHKRMHTSVQAQKHSREDTGLEHLSNVPLQMGARYMTGREKKTGPVTTLEVGHG